MNEGTRDQPMDCVDFEKAFGTVNRDFISNFTRFFDDFGLSFILKCSQAS